MKDGAHKYIVAGVQKNSGPKAVRFQAEGVDRESKAHDHNEKTEKRAMKHELETNFREEYAAGKVWKKDYRMQQYRKYLSDK